MTKLPAYLLWHQALNLMVTGEPRDTDPALLEMEPVYAAAFGERPPVYCMTLDRARDELMDRVATGAAIAIGQKREAVGVNGYETKSFPSPIEPIAWVNLEIDDATSDATIHRLEASIPGQGYAKVRLRREDVLAAREAVLAEQRAEQTELIGLLAPIEPAPPAPAKNKGGSPGLSCRDDAIAAAVEYLLEVGGECEPDAIPKTVRFIKKWIEENDDDGGPMAPNTYKSWAREAQKRCQEAKRQ